MANAEEILADSAGHGTSVPVEPDEDSALLLELCKRIAVGDFDDRSLWSEPILDPGEYLRRALAAEISGST